MTCVLLLHTWKMRSHREVAVALLQAIVEFNLGCPSALAAKPLALRKAVFEAYVPTVANALCACVRVDSGIAANSLCLHRHPRFWDSESGRFGNAEDVGGTESIGWSAWFAERAKKLGAAAATVKPSLPRSGSRWGERTVGKPGTHEESKSSGGAPERQGDHTALRRAFEMATRATKQARGSVQPISQPETPHGWGFLTTNELGDNVHVQTGAQRDRSSRVATTPTTGLYEAGASAGSDGLAAGSTRAASAAADGDAGENAPVEGPELPPGHGVDLPHGRIVDIKGRRMVYSIMHGYHLPLDEAPLDSSAIYRKILGDVATTQASARASAKKKDQVVEDVPANDPFVACAWLVAHMCSPT